MSAAAAAVEIRIRAPLRGLDVNMHRARGRSTFSYFGFTLTNLRHACYPSVISAVPPPAVLFALFPFFGGIVEDA